MDRSYEDGERSRCLLCGGGDWHALIEWQAWKSLHCLTRMAASPRLLWPGGDRGSGLVLSADGDGVRMSADCHGLWISIGPTYSR